jgi:hypothetical protein
VTQFVTQFVTNSHFPIKKAFNKIAESLYWCVVGTARFELATTCPPDKCATRLRYAPNETRGYLSFPLPGVKKEVTYWIKDHKQS